MFSGISTAESARIFVAPVALAKIVNRNDGTRFKEAAGARKYQCTAFSYVCSNATAGQLVIPVPKGTRLLPCEYVDIFEDLERLRGGKLAQYPRKPVLAEIRPDPGKIELELPNLDISWEYIHVQIAGSVWQGVTEPVWYFHPILDKILVPTYCVCLSAKVQRATTTRDVNDRGLEITMRRMPSHNRQYIARANWTIYAQNMSKRIDAAHTTAGDLQDSCNLEMWCRGDEDDNGEIQFYSRINPIRLPALLEFGDPATICFIWPNDQLNEYVFL